MDLSKIKNFFSIGKAKNTISPDMRALGNEFLRRGNRGGVMANDWSTVKMTDVDFYSGYSYAAINNRANKVSQLGIKNLVTTSTPALQDAARKKDELIIHPYLNLIDESNDFTNSAFWYDISTYLDLEGVYYLMAVRAVAPGLVGDIQYFKMLNPYEIRRVRNKETMEVGGYIEQRDGMQREIPKEMIIEIRKMNPFSRDENFAMTDAAKDYQFTMKQASDFTRSSLKNNVSAPGIISTDIIMEDEMFANFKSRVMSQERGAPLFGNGAGAIKWEPMQIDMDKAALSDINEINRSTLFAVSGVSKTTMGIEESGTTREVSRTQKDKFIEDHIMPQLQLIIDALNQDYKIYYSKEYKKNKYTIIIDSPMAADKDAELKDVEIAQSAFDLYMDLLASGYDAVLSAKYANGQISLSDLGKPKVIVTKKKDDEEKPDTLKEVEDKPDSKKKQNLDHEHEDDLAKANNDLESGTIEQINTQESALQNAVINVEGRFVGSVIDKLTDVKNSFEFDFDYVDKNQKKDSVNELALALASYYLILFPIYANQLMRKRSSEHEVIASFQMTDDIKALIASSSLAASKSHIDTIINDLRSTIQKVSQDAYQSELSKLLASGAEENEELYTLARKKALEGTGQAQIVSAIKQKYQEISQGRAKVIASNEANRAFTLSQFEADKQFLNITGLMSRAYKKWQVNGSHPCSYCINMSYKGMIPFEQNFADIGDQISSTVIRDDGSASVKKLSIGYEAVQAGQLHVNCRCKYILVIK